MKKNILLLMFFVVSTLAVAQPPRGANMEERIKRQLAALKDRCSLTDEQIPKVENILKASSGKMLLAFQERTGDRQAMREKMTAIRTERDGALKTVLSEAQYVEYQALLEEQAQLRRQMMEQREEQASPKEKKKRKKKRKAKEEKESGI